MLQAIFMLHLLSFTENHFMLEFNKFSIAQFI